MSKIQCYICRTGRLKNQGIAVNNCLHCQDIENNIYELMKRIERVAELNKDEKFLKISKDEWRKIWCSYFIFCGSTILGGKRYDEQGDL
jgi:hypothetical protein